MPLPREMCSVVWTYLERAPIESAKSPVLFLDSREFWQRRFCGGLRPPPRRTRTPRRPGVCQDFLIPRAGNQLLRSRADSMSIYAAVGRPPSAADGSTGSGDIQTPGPLVRDLFPDLDEQQLSDVEETLHGYLEAAWRIYERLERERPEVFDR
jgi:hypothetical protein